MKDQALFPFSSFLNVLFVSCSLYSPCPYPCLQEIRLPVAGRSFTYPNSQFFIIVQSCFQIKKGYLMTPFC